MTAREVMFLPDKDDGNLVIVTVQTRTGHARSHRRHFRCASLRRLCNLVAELARRGEFTTRLASTCVGYCVYEVLEEPEEAVRLQDPDPWTGLYIPKPEEPEDIWANAVTQDADTRDDREFTVIRFFDIDTFQRFLRHWDLYTKDQYIHGPDSNWIYVGWWYQRENYIKARILSEVVPQWQVTGR